MIEPDFLRTDLRAEAEATIDHKALSTIDFKGRVRLTDFQVIIDLTTKGILMMIDCKYVAQRRRYVYLTWCVNILRVFLENVHEFNIYGKKQCERARIVLSCEHFLTS